MSIPNSINNSINSKHPYRTNATTNIAPRRPSNNTKTQNNNIASDIKEGLNTLQGVKPSSIHVDTVGDIVNISGKVASLKTEILIEDLAKQTQGVSQVNNELEVIPNNSIKK